MQEQDASILRGAAVPTALVGVLLVVVFSVVSGMEGFLGALIGVLVVMAFFGLSLLVTSKASRHGPTVLMAAALITYVVKIVLLGVLLVTLRNTDWFSFRAFGLSILVALVVWLSGQVRAFTKYKMLYVEPGSPGWSR